MEFKPALVRTLTVVLTVRLPKSHLLSPWRVASEVDEGLIHSQISYKEEYAFQEFLSEEQVRRQSK